MDRTIPTRRGFLYGGWYRGRLIAAAVLLAVSCGWYVAIIAAYSDFADLL